MSLTSILPHGKKQYVAQFFTLESGEKNGNSATYRCRLHPEAPVFKAHFPGFPVLPGVLTLKMVVDAINASQFFSTQTLTVQSIGNAKYLAVVNPQETQEVEISVALKAEKNADELTVFQFKATVQNGETRFATFSFSCTAADFITVGVEENEVCAVIPTYQNAKTLLKVVADVHRVVDTVFVVDDGSNDGTAALLDKTTGNERPEKVLTHPKNCGKGAALKTGLTYARQQGFRYAVTVDADGQHRADDIPALLKAVEEEPDALAIGSRGLQHENMPAKSTFANRFSNFWFALQTLQRLPDTQSGLRVYPLRRLHGLRWMSARYEAELTLLVFSAWAGVKLLPVPVSVYYPPRDQRVTHFRTGRDFTRISVLNTLLCFLMVVYGWPRIFCRQIARGVKGVFRK
ncbi:MAG: glycosyltransferase [Prevotellamassilia sp.]|nr:glycosyltransferase [Prevotellamassilia sp.]